MFMVVDVCQSSGQFLFICGDLPFESCCSCMHSRKLRLFLINALKIMEWLCDVGNEQCTSGL